MKKKIGILGSTGSIGQQTLEIIKMNKKSFSVELLTANKNYNLLSKQIKLFNVKNVIVNDRNAYNFLKKKFKKTHIFNDFKEINKLKKLKLDYVMSAITGLQGLEPTIDIIKKTKTIAIANKESLICGWNLIHAKLRENKTLFIPVDSEHFSIWQLIKNKKKKQIKEIYLTASGGPFLNTPINKFKKINYKQASNHPNWSMGSKISIDSSTLMNKVFEVIEASNIFDIELKKFKIIIHPKSYVHSIVNYNSGFCEMLFHETDMKIPIFNSIYYENANSNYSSSKINFKLLNNLNFSEVDKIKFSSINLLQLLPHRMSLFNTVLVSSNDALLEFFKSKKIKFKDISKYIFKIINLKKYSYTRFKKPRNIGEIYNLMDDVFVTARDICNIQKNEKI